MSFRVSDLVAHGIIQGDSAYANIFYDSANTAYYLDPAGTSVLNGLTVGGSSVVTNNGGTWNINISGSANTLDGLDSSDFMRNYGMLNNTDVYVNFRVMRNSNSSSANDGMYIGYGNTNGGITRIFGGGATSGELIKYSNYTYEPGSFRAPIFYDSENTAYYVDPAGTSNLNGLTVVGGAIITGPNAWNAATPVLNVGGTGDGRIQVRHIYGKSSTSASADHLWLQYQNTGNHIQVGDSGGGNNLYVSGNIFMNGYFGGNLVATQSWVSSQGYVTGSYLPLSGGTLSGTLTIGGAVGSYIWNDGSGTYIEAYGNSTATRKIRIQGNNGSGSYAQWFVDAGNQQIYGEIGGYANLLFNTNAVYLRYNGSNKFWTGSDGTRTQGWSYYQDNSAGMHWPNNGWHLLPSNSADFRIHSGNASESSLRMETNGITRGYFYTNSSNEIGILNNSRSWGFRMTSGLNAFIHGQTLTINADNAAWSSIYMNDGDQGMREIHCNSNRIGFLNQSGNWGAWNDDNGNWGMSLNAYMAGNRFDIQGAEGQISFKDGDNVWTGYVGFTGNLGYLSFPGRNVKINSGYNGTITLETGVSGYNDGVVSIPYGRLIVNNNYIYSGSYIEAGSDMRAPIFYDSNNTAYYGNFASTSRMAYVTMDQSTGAHNHMTYGGYFSGGDWQTLTNTEGQLNVVQVNNINAGGYSNQPPNVYTYGGVLSWRTSNHSFQLYASHTGDITFKTQWNNDNYSGWRRILHESNFNTWAPTLTGGGASGTWGINITGNAGNTSSISNAVGSSYTWGGQQYFMSNLGGYSGSLSGPPLQAYSTSNNSAFMSFHKGGYYAVNMGLDADNVLRIGGWSASANRWELDMSGNCWVAGSFRAPIFYDSANTAYYLDPNATTSIRTVGSWRSDSGAWDGEFSGKIQYHSNHWYFQAADLWLFRNAGGSNVFSVTQGGNGAFSGSLTTNGQVYINNGDPTIFLMDSNNRSSMIHCNSNIFYILRGSGNNSTSWATFNGYWPLELSLETNDAVFGRNITAPVGTITAGNDMRAPIFYDSNDTTYYADFNNTGRSMYTAGYLQSDRLIMKGSSGGGQIYPTISYGGVSLYGGDQLTNGAYFTVTGIDYGSSPGAGSAEFVIRSTATSKFAMFSYNGSTWTGRYALFGSTGNVTIGDANTDIGYRLYVIGDIYATGNVIAYSDARVKTNIREIENPLARVLNTRGVMYDRTDNEEKDNVGFIAQELEKEFPELISTSTDGRKGVKYQNMVAVLIEAMKEQNKEIQKLKMLINGTTN